MLSEQKLEEAKYFLEGMKKTRIEPKSCYFNYSAFLSAWRSVFETLLYEGAIYYGIYDQYLKRYRKIPRELKSNEEKYLFIAAQIGNSQAVEFFGWMKAKLTEIRHTDLYQERNKAVHEGKIPEINYVPFQIGLPDGHFSLIGFTESRRFQKQITPYITNCEEEYCIAEKTVKEAVAKFHINDKQ
ncbi:MAG: hypothetical protein ABSB71_12490 [Candidatus Bathyarchaeia archaeon]|jgi:hypothetical protein